MTMIENSLNHAEFSYDGARWITLRKPQPTIAADARTLLARSAQPRPGNLRYTISAGAVYLLGEQRDVSGLMEIPKAYERMTADTGDLVVELPHDDVACALAETGYQWSIAQDDPDVWKAVASDPRGYRCDLLAKIVPGGVKVQGVLTTWGTDLCDVSQEALARFLIAAHDRVRFARFLLEGRSASAASFAAADRLEMELPDSVFAVVAAGRLAWREVRALANEQVARAYLESTA